MTFFQRAMFAPRSDWRPTPVSRLPSWAGARRVSIDIETHDPKLTTLGPGVRRDGRVVGVGFKIEDGPAHYLPFGHLGGDNLPEEHVWAYLKDQAKSYREVIVGAGMQYDLDYLEQAGVCFRPSWFRDVQIAEPLLDELQFTYGLDAIAGRYGRPGKDESLLEEAALAHGLHPKNDLWRLPARYIGAYVEQDVALPLDLIRLQERKIEEQDLQRVYDLESRLLPVLVKMRRRGVRIDFDALCRVEAEAKRQEAEALAALKAETGVDVPLGGVWKADLVERALRDGGASLDKRTPKGKLCLDKAVIQGLAKAGCRAAELVAKARKVNKIWSTYVESVRRYQTRGRIHATFNQLRVSSDEGDDESGAAFGRMSSVDPNIQQQVGRDPFWAPLWRAVYLPEEGSLWASCDYSSQEPRWAVHYATLIGAPGAEELAKRYRDDPKTDLHQMTADLAGIPRKDAKTIFLGLIYGMGGAKLCRSLGLPTKWVVARGKRWGRVNAQGVKEIEVAGPEGEALMGKFNKMVPFIKSLTDLASSKAARVGYVRTHSGRRCRFERGRDGSCLYTHKAANRVIQGSSADQTKQAVVEIDAAGHYLQLQVHDEVDLSVRGEDEGLEVAKIMEECVQLRTTSKVDVAVGPSWGATL